MMEVNEAALREIIVDMALGRRPTPAGFAVLYDRNVEREGAEPGGVIMCQPGETVSEASERVTAGQVHEGMKDNWRHRSAGMRCRTCMYYVPKVVDTPFPEDERSPEVGRCRRRAPTLNGWPAMMPTDWCGDHKLDETKV